MNFYSRPDQAQPQVPADQVQGPLPALRLLPCPEGLRQGRQAQAEPASLYVEPHYNRHIRNRIALTASAFQNSNKLGWSICRRDWPDDIARNLPIEENANIALSPLALKVVDVSKGEKKNL